MGTERLSDLLKAAQQLSGAPGFEPGLSVPTLPLLEGESGGNGRTPLKPRLICPAWPQAAWPGGFPSKFSSAPETP